MALVDHSLMKLGRVRAKPDPRWKSLDNYTRASLLPSSGVTWYARVPEWPMFANDEVGDCTCAAVGHIIQQWTTYTDASAVVMSDSQVLAAYSAITGYVLGEPSTDQGAMCGDVLKYWIITGFSTPDGGPDTLTGAARVDPRDADAVRRAITTFGNIYAGVALPTSAQTEEVWSDTQDEPGSWGGHCVPLVGFNDIGPICVTWGGLKRMTWAWWASYAEEAYALLSPDWMRATGTDPAGVNWNALAADMKALCA